jgi:hypothetical protein
MLSIFKPKPTCERASVEIFVDSSPDLSYLGEYSDSPGPNAIRVNRRGAYRFFNPAMSGEETGNPDSPSQDFARRESYGDSWYMCAIRASVEVAFPNDDGTFTLETIRSPGLWGIESDSGKTYLESVARDELSQLEETLSSLKIPKRVISAACRDIRWKGEAP